MTDRKLLSEAIEEYLRFRRPRYSQATVDNEAFVLRRFLADHGDVQVRHMNPARVAAWFYGEHGLLGEHVTRDRQRRAAIAPSTANFYRSRIASLCRFMTKRGWLRQDLLADVPALKVTRRVRLQPPPEVLLRLLDLAENERDRAYLATIVNTGCRAKEALTLTVGAVCLAEGSLRVTIFKTTEEDDFPITADLDGELRRWLRKYALDMGRPVGGNDFLFPARRGPRYQWITGPDGQRQRVQTPPSWDSSKPLTHSERIVQSALRKAGLPTKGEGTHTVRRAVARAFFDSMDADVGYDAALRTVSALLHHGSSATTEHYLGLTSEKKRRDTRLRGQPFLTQMVKRADVISIAERSN